MVVIGFVQQVFGCEIYAPGRLVPGQFGIHNRVWLILHYLSGVCTVLIETVVSGAVDPACRQVQVEFLEQLQIKLENEFVTEILQGIIGFETLVGLLVLVYVSVTEVYAAYGEISLSQEQVRFQSERDFLPYGIDYGMVH